MVETALLNALIMDSGLKKRYIARQLGMCESAFWRKCTNETQFSGSEVIKLCNILGITTLEQQKAIFFNDDVHE